MLRKSVLALFMTLSLVSCDEPKQDKLKSQGGISPDPSGIISGSVLYVGPRPYCKHDSRGRATRVQGRVVLTLFAFDNPPPPEGRASTPLNLKFLNADELFTVSDCLPEGEVADPDGPRITRSIPFSWSQIVLGKGRQSVRYQIRGWYDSDEDMNLFGVKSLPTEGDIAGAALADVQDPSKGFLPIVLPGAADAPNGYRRQGVIVAFGNYIWLERPIFTLNQYRFMEANKTVVARQVANSTEIDINATLREARSNTCTGSLTCGLSLDQVTPEEFDATFKRADVQLDFSTDKYAFISEPVDVLTIKAGEADLAKADGVPDPHPLLGSNLGVPWFTPIVIMTRLAPTPAMQEIETRAGIPSVRLIGTVLLENAVTPAEGPRPRKRTVLDSIDIAVPPVAAVELDANDPLCRVPYLAPGNYTRAFESRLAYCSDLPTGIYNIAALQGVAGGARTEATPDVSDNGFVYDGGRFSSQAWTVPNDLGSPLQVGEQALSSQSMAGAFVVYDRDVDKQGSCATAQDPDNDLNVRAVKYRKVCTGGEEVRIENPAGAVGAGIDGTGCLPTSCCEAVSHLCGVPLCEVCDEEHCPDLDLGSNHPIRQGPTSITATTKDGKAIPDCLPFALPSLCCDD